MTVPSGWEERRLDRWGRIVSGSTPSTAVPAFWDGEIVWVTPFDLSRLARPYLTDSSKRISEAGLKSCSAQLMPAGSVVISSRAPIGYVAIPDVRFCTNQGCKAIELNDGIDSEFAYYNVAFNVDKIKGLGEGTTFAEISKAALSTVRLSFPKRTEEQVQIAGVLSAVDRAIERTDAVLVKQQRIRNGLSQALLAYGLDEHGALRTERKHKFKDSHLGRIPQEWKVGTLLDVTERDRQPILTGPFGADLGDSDFVEEGVPVLRIGNVQRGRLDLSDLLFVSPTKALELRRYIVKTGDLLFARQGATTGRNALADDNANGCLINYHIIRVALDHDRCAPRFIEALFDSDSVTRQVNREKGRGTREGINTAQLKALQLKLPPVSEQRTISAILEGHDRRGANTQQLKVKLVRLKSGLMRDLLTGNKRVTPLLEEAGLTLEQVS